MSPRAATKPAVAEPVSVEQAEADLRAAITQKDALEAKNKSGQPVDFVEWQVAREKVAYLEQCLEGARVAEARRDTAARQGAVKELRAEMTECFAKSTAGITEALDAIALGVELVASRVDTHNDEVGALHSRLVALRPADVPMDRPEDLPGWYRAAEATLVGDQQPVTLMLGTLVDAIRRYSDTSGEGRSVDFASLRELEAHREPVRHLRELATRLNRQQEQA